MMELTPGMRQYMEVKDKHPDCIVLFRMGDFYETFFEDAKTVSRVLDITLTARGKGEKRAPLAGIPYHALDNYLAKLVKRGFKVCMVEQLEDPKLAKGLVKRGVTRIVTPGTVIEDNMLTQSNNFIMSLNKEDDSYGIAISDISTGEFITTEVKNLLKLFGEIEKYSPAEIIVPTSYEQSDIVKDIKNRGYYVNSFDDRFYWIDKARKALLEHFKVENFDGYGINDKDAIITSSGALLSYLKETQFNALNHINKIRNYSVDEFMILDSSTQRNLELLKNIKDGTSRGSLFDVINKTITPMGSRKLRQWLLRPLLNVDKIKKRLNAIEELNKDSILREEIKQILDKISDIERISARITYGSANARDLVSLKNSLKYIPDLKKLLTNSESNFLKEIHEINPLDELVNIIETTIKEEPNTSLREGNIIKKGFNEELDELRMLSTNAKEWLAKFEEDEREKTGIKNLKVRYNKIFGYFIEVSKSNLNLVPESYIRKQTQANSERYFTEDLKNKENMILGAQDKIQALEYDLFLEVLKAALEKIEGIQDIASKISSLDCLYSLSIVSKNNNYCKPEIFEKSQIEIIKGRHPVVEILEANFVDNDCILNDEEIMKIITGPNMAGKSTYLRQNALIVLLAQIGSYVPAAEAKIGIVDRIFTRVGAYDDLSQGQSTFMVEMNETANILNNATEKSFVILDEIGRGTSTYDGFSLAWAIAEFLITKIKSKTMFATHYHQLNKMCEEFSGIKNYHISVKEENDEIIFLRKIVLGGTDRSYGIQVAKLAGLPEDVIHKAKVLMKTLEKEDQIMKSLEEEVIEKQEVEKEEGQKELKEISWRDISKKQEPKNKSQLTLSGFEK
ncbi:DNA mismatch repair protein MutS [Candidatus Woesearchaeota archaeon]|nr:DNA mismatch repair protein MutS [Candidatus Woesearchaeota archaeon]